MFDKIMQWIFGKVAPKKVIGKLAKHATGAIIGLLFGGQIAPYVKPIFDSMNLSQGQVEAGMTVALIGIFGAAWNYIEHRFIKK